MQNRNVQFHGGADESAGDQHYDFNNKMKRDRRFTPFPGEFEKQTQMHTVMANLRQGIAPFLDRKHLKVSASCTSFGVCSNCAAGSCQSFGICDKCPLSNSSSAVSACSNCEGGSFLFMKLCKDCAKLTMKGEAHKQKDPVQADETSVSSTENIQEVQVCDSMNICGECAKLKSTSCKSIGICENCTLKATTEGIDKCESRNVCNDCANLARESCKSIGICDRCTRLAEGTTALPTCESFNVCKDCSKAPESDSTSFSQAPKRELMANDESIEPCESKAICADCAKIQSASCYSIGICENCTLKATKGALDSCQSRDVCADCSKLDSVSCKSVGICDRCTRREKGTTALPTCESFNVCTDCAIGTSSESALSTETQRDLQIRENDEIPPCESRNVCNDCAKMNSESCKSIGICENCTQKATNEALNNCQSRDVCNDCARMDTESCKSIGICNKCTRRAKGLTALPSCDSFQVCKDCARGSSSNSSTSVGTLNCKSFNVCSHCAVARHVYQENSKQSDNVSKTNNQGGSSSANQKKERVRPRSAKKRSQRSKGNNCKGLELETEKLRVLHDLEREARSLVETSSSCTDPLDFKSPHRGTKNLNRLVAAMSELLSSVEGMSFDLKTLQKEIHAMKSTKSQPNPQMKRVS